MALEIIEVTLHKDYPYEIRMYIEPKLGKYMRQSFVLVNLKSHRPTLNSLTRKEINYVDRLNDWTFKVVLKEEFNITDPKVVAKLYRLRNLKKWV